MLFYKVSVFKNKAQQTTKFNRQEELQVAPAAVFLQYIILLHLCTKSSVDEDDAKFKQSACRKKKDAFVLHVSLLYYYILLIEQTTFYVKKFDLFFKMFRNFSEHFYFKTEYHLIL